MDLRLQICYTFWDKIINYHQQMDKTSSFIEQMTHTIIRPGRDSYANEQLGPRQLIVKRKPGRNSAQKQRQQYIQVHRKDTQVMLKGQNIQLSYFYAKENPPSESNAQRLTYGNLGELESRKCVIYMHGNSGSRTQGIDLAKYVMTMGWNLALFDYRGSGMSDGDYTSMGVHQSQDLSAVILHLLKTEGIRQYSFWGRSMGAVTILYFLIHNYPSLSQQGISVNNIVLDSPFGDMRKLMHQLGSSSIHLPDFIFQPLASSINQQVKMKIGVDLLLELNLIQKYSEIKTGKKYQLNTLLSNIGALFITSKQDKLVHYSHAEELKKVVPFSPNQIFYHKGEHNDVRAENLKWKCTQFLCEPFQSTKKEIKVVNKPFQLYTISQQRPEPNVKRNEIVGKLPRESVGLGKEGQFFMTPLDKKSDYFSPKFQKTKIGGHKHGAKRESIGQIIPDIPIDVKQYSSEPRIQLPPQQLYQSSAPSHLQPQPQTIIINHNYNVSVNYYNDRNNHTQNHSKNSKKQQQPQSNVIPPIKFSTGHMTDRIKDPQQPRYFVPHTAKTQKHGNFTPFSSQSQQHQVGVSPHQANSLSYVPVSEQLSGNIKIQHQAHHKKPKLSIDPSIDIPLISFEDLENQPHSHSMLTPNSPMEPFQASHSFVPSRKNEERQKMSLSQLRKVQKQQQSKCVMKSSKVISFKNRNQRQQKAEQFTKLKLKKQISIIQQSWKYRSQDQLSKPKIMKTSLMAKRKNQRKNSDSMSNTVKSIVLKTQPTQKNHQSIFQMGRPQVLSPKESTKKQQNLLHFKRPKQ